MGRLRTFTWQDLADRCGVCGKLVHPKDIRRLDSDRSLCPHCGKVYTYAGPRTQQLSADFAN